MADEDPVSAYPGAHDPAEDVLVPDVLEPAIRPSVDGEGGGRGLLDVIGPSGGSGEAFEVLTDVDGSIVVRLMGPVKEELEDALRARGGYEP